MDETSYSNVEHVAVDGDWGYGGKLRDKVDECIEKLNR